MNIYFFTLSFSSINYIVLYIEIVYILLISTKNYKNINYSKKKIKINEITLGKTMIIIMEIFVELLSIMFIWIIL